MTLTTESEKKLKWLNVPSENSHLVAIAAVFLFAFLLRVTTLNQSSLWLDELFSYQRATQPNWESMLLMLERAGHAPLFDGILLHFWVKLGKSEFFLRFLPMSIGMLSIAGIYTLGRALINSKIGLLSALLVTISPSHIFYSQELRMYTLAFLCTTFGIYFFYKASFAKMGRVNRYWIGYTVCAVLGLYTHYTTGFIFLTLFIFDFVRILSKRNFSALWSLFLSHLTIAILFAPWLPTLWNQLHSPHLMWIPETSIGRIFNEFIPLYLNERFLRPVFLPVAASVLVVLIAGLANWSSKAQHNAASDARQRYLLAVATALGPIGILLTVSIFKPMIVNRYILILGPAIFILSTSGIVWFLKRYLTALIPLIVIMGIVISSWGVVRTDPKENWRGIMTYIAEHSTPEDVAVFIPAALQNLLSIYYDIPITAYGISAPLDAESMHQLSQDLQTFERAWVLTRRSTDYEVAMLEFVENQYSERSVSCQEFGPINLCLYSKLDTQG